MKKSTVSLGTAALLSTTLVMGCGNTQSATHSSSSSATNVAATMSARHDVNAITDITRDVRVTSRSPVTTGLSLSSLATQPIVAIKFSTPYSGYAASANHIYHTADGGKTWRLTYTSTDPIVGLAAKAQGHIENVVAFTKSYLLWSTNGQEFHIQRLPHKGSLFIQSVSLLSDASIWVVNNGKVWVSGGLDGALKMASPMTPIQSVAAYDDNTAYATGAGVVYKTTNHGQSWAKIYAPSIEHPQSHWNSEVQVEGNHVAAYFYGGEAGMSQQAFILYESNNAGKTWQPMVDEAYFGPVYGSPKVLVQKNVGAQPGPFQLLSNGNIVFTGIDVGTNGPKVTTITRTGHVAESVSFTQVQFDIWQNKLSIAVPDSKHYFVAGGKDSKGALAVSVNAGRTWHRG